MSLRLFEGPFAGLRERHYRTILCDVPWKYVTWSGRGMGKSPDMHYDTMTLDEIKALPVAELCHPEGTVLHFWVIDSHLKFMFDIVEAWGFKYKTTGFYWAKTGREETTFPIGTGFWTRANPETACECWSGADEQECEKSFLATYRHPKRVDKGVRRLVVAPRREHSRKPDEVPERIMKLTHGPYLELFGRQSRPGWTVWGKERDKFDHPIGPDRVWTPARMDALESAI
jgi:N6-adenosine-specific RNA methylase IME4